MKIVVKAYEEKDKLGNEYLDGRDIELTFDDEEFSKEWIALRVDGMVIRLRTSELKNICLVFSNKLIDNSCR